MICDDIEPIVEKYALILQQAQDIQVVGCVHSGREAVRMAVETKPDVILMDIEMETCDAGIVATKEILKSLPKARIVVLTVHQADHMVFEAFSAGVVDYMLKDASPEMIVKGVRDAADNKTTLDPALFAKLRSEVTQIMREQENTMDLINQLFRLSSIEIEVLNLLLEGKSRSEISSIRCVEASTTKSQIHSMLSKTSASSTAQLVEWIRRMNLEKFVFNMQSRA